MQVDERLLEQMQIDLETVHGQLATGMINPAVSEDTKVLAAAIAQAGAQIALALASRVENGRA
jgi:hypothetical protein